MRTTYWKRTYAVLYQYMDYVWCVSAVHCEVRDRLTRPVSCRPHSTPEWGLASSEPSSASLSQSSHSGLGPEHSTAQHNAHWTDTARRRSGWHSAPGSDVETLKDKVGMTRFLVTTGAGEHGFRCAGFFSCSLLLWRSSKWNGVTYIHSFPWADHLPAESRKHWKKTFGGAQLQHSSLWTVAHWPLTLQMLTCPFLTVKTLL